MNELDWVIEYENLPPDEVDPFELPPDPGRNSPRWLWFALGAALVIAAVAAALWFLGGDDAPVPLRNPLKEKLAAAVALEIQALQTGDLQLLNQLRDNPGSATGLQPPPEAWRDATEASGPANPAGSIELVGLELIDERTGLAEIRIGWDGRSYQLNWRYELRNNTWRHARWKQDSDASPAELVGSYLTITHHPDDQAQAAALGERIDEMMDTFCSLLPCSHELERAQLTLEAKPYVNYFVIASRPGVYAAASPSQFRWPLDGTAEPLLLGSVARHLATDRYLRWVMTGLPQENQLALTLGTFWMVHHLLELENPPATAWLDRALARDGLAATSDFLLALRSGIPPQQALRASFQPPTVAVIQVTPDYFGWLALISSGSAGRHYGRNLDAFGGHLPETLLTRFDRLVDPWSPQGQPYALVGPTLTGLTFEQNWAIASNDNDPNWPARIYFQLGEDRQWQLDLPDESLMGELVSDQVGELRLDYYARDAPYINDLARTLDNAWQRMNDNFGPLEQSAGPIIILVAPPFASPPLERWDIRLDSPNAPDAPPADEWLDQGTMQLAGHLLGRVKAFAELPDDRFLLLLGLYSWQLTDLGIEQDTLIAQFLVGEGALHWTPPPDPAAANWVPLIELWSRPHQEPPPEKMEAYLRLPILLVAYVADTYGSEQLPRMIEAMVNEDSLDDWVLTLTGEPLESFELAFRRWVIENWQN